MCSVFSVCNTPFLLRHNTAVWFQWERWHLLSAERAKKHLRTRAAAAKRLLHSSLRMQVFCITSWSTWSSFRHQPEKSDNLLL